MATLRGFARRMRKRANDIPDQVNKVIRKAAIAGDQVLTTQTPVDTGRAASSWIASIGTPSKNQASSPFSPTAAHTANRSTIGRRKSEQAIYLTNNVDYIVYLDQGSSAKAPSGMTKSAIAAIRNVIRTAKVVKK